MRSLLLASLGLGFLLASSVAFSADKADTSAKLKCPISGEAVDKSVTSDYGGGKICFCCADCKAKFEADHAKYATKANLQLAASGQAKQTKCPFSGGAIKSETAVNVAGVDVQFCCNNCKAKVTAAKPDKQIELVFEDKAFKKAFKVGKE